MTTAQEHAQNLLAAIIPNRHDLLDRALRDLNPDHIADRILANMLVMLERYSGITRSVLTRDALADMMNSSKVDPGTIAAYQERYDELAGQAVDDATFRWSLLQVRELAADRSTQQALTEGMEVLTRGLPGDNNEVLQGHAEARAHVLSRFADIDRNLSMQEAPEGDMRGEGKDILADYAKQKELTRAGLGGGIKFGVHALDERVGGLHNGELVLLVGFTSDGKTSLSCQLTWSAVVEQGKNVLFLTTETIRSQVRRRLIARHSCLPQFGNPEGLNSRNIKEGNLTDEEEKRLHAVVDDFDANPDYGRLYLAQVPRAASMMYVESKGIRVARQMKVDLIVMDYLALLKSERKRGTDREELSSILKAAKQMSTTFNDGNGVAFVSPWQVSRSARIEAEARGAYTLNATSETAETSNSADTIISLLAPLDNESRVTKVKAQIMKHRDGEKAKSIELSVDYATSRFTAAHDFVTPVDNVWGELGALI